MDAESLISGGERVKVLLEQDILDVNVSEEQINLGLVTSGAATDDGTDNLQHGGDAGAACDHAEVAHHVGGVDHGALGALDFDGLADDEGGHVLGDVAGGVGLDEQVEVTWLVVARDRGVGAEEVLANGLALGVRCGEVRGDGDVLSDWEAEDRVGGWELEAVAVGEWLSVGFLRTQNACRRDHSHCDIVGNDGLLLQLEFLEGIGPEDCLRVYAICQ